ncbi:MAG TPA: hypothetical protein DDY53_04515 [Clostridiales bacterium]|jgi:hypothetical protein|nr:hypothetical protein [Clostridiales bacterium]
MQKVGIVTLYGNSNFGNKLQNYAIQKKVSSLGFDVVTLRTYNSTAKYFPFIENRFKYLLKNIFNKYLYRNKNFKRFENKYLVNSKKIYFSNEINDKCNNAFDYFIIGSDQVWNPVFGLKDNLTFLPFTNNKCAFSASFGVNKLEDISNSYIENLNNIKYISVREDAGKSIIERITGRNDVQVLIDPTMLLTSEEWSMLALRPHCYNNQKYILNYFLGDISDNVKNKINDIAKKYDCDVINILDKNSQYYMCGPSEFLFLEKNAFLICTDSFHSSVFAVLFNNPFIVFDRYDYSDSMNSRLDTLISKLHLKNRRYNGKNITKENLEHDYTEAYQILEEERKKSDAFLKNALDIKE